MNSYLMHFATYTFAMIGFIVIVLFIYKKSICLPTQSRSRNFLKVENTLKLAPTKTVYVIKAGNERFLVAGDAGSTTMLAKLDDNNIEIQEEVTQEKVMDFSTLKESLQRMRRG